MKNIFVLFLFFFVCFKNTIIAQSSNVTNLFNGKDLSGWIQYNGKAKYTVEHGELVGRTILNQPNSFLSTEKKYGDFILELDLKVDEHMNSGIQFRSEMNDNNDHCEVTDKLTPNRVHGYQMEIDPSDRAWSGGIYDEARRGWLYPLEYNMAAKSAFKNNQWNHYKIEAIGNSIRTWVNGIACAHIIDNMTPTGFISLQVHQIKDPKEVGQEVRWKNIKIQTVNLKPAPPTNLFVVNLIPNTISSDEQKNGVRLLWDGVSTKGWKGAGKKPFPDKAWVVKDGVLSIKGKNGRAPNSGGDILTEAEFHAFDLQFEFKITDTANSGVKYFVTEKEEAGGAGLGLEYQILDDDKHPDALMGSIGNRTMASLYDMIPALRIGAVRREKFAIGQWNRGRIIVFPDGKTEHWINGWKVVEYQRGTQYYYALVAKSKYAALPNFGMADKGHLLLQDHGTDVSFRSIKIKEL